MSITKGNLRYLQTVWREERQAALRAIKRESPAMPIPRKLIPTPSSQRVIDLRTEGRTFEEIAELLGISRQRVHQILKR